MARWQQPIDQYLRSEDWWWVRRQKRRENEEGNGGDFLCENCGKNLRHEAG